MSKIHNKYIQKSLFYVFVSSALYYVELCKIAKD